MRKPAALIFVLAAFVLVGLIGCSDEENPVNPLTGFEPEVANEGGVFQFQVTEVESVTTALVYSWENNSTQANINHSSEIIEGSASMNLYDADNNLVYTNGLSASLNENSQSGTPGIWRVEIVLVNLSGSLNFSAQATEQS